jgi:bile acid:Na+ symporter, BASS family
VDPQPYMSCRSPAARTSEVTDHLTVVLKITLAVFIASSLLDMGLRLDPPDAARGLRNVRFVGLTFFWGFVASPALALAITRFLPLAPPYVMGLLLMGIMPCAPFLPMIVERAKGDVGYTAAFMLLTSIATIVIMPLAVPLMIEGLTVGAWTITKPLVLVALLPLVIGMVLRHVSTVLAMRLQPLVKRTSSLATVVVLVACVVVFVRGLIGVAGSLAVAAQLIYFAAITALPYWIGCGLPHDQKIVLSCGMATRNLGVALAPLFSLAEVDQRAIAMVVLGLPITVAFTLGAGLLFRHTVDWDVSCGRFPRES